MNPQRPPPRLDLLAFARSAGVLSGSDLLSNYERLMQETKGLGPENALIWSARGEWLTHPPGGPQVWLHLKANAELALTCQRCLGLAALNVDVMRSFRFCATEEQAQAEDAQADEDLLVLCDDFNLAELIEDEMLLALPLVPRHRVCPVPVRMALADPDFETALLERRQPFTVLEKFKIGGSSNRQS